MKALPPKQIDKALDLAIKVGFLSWIYKITFRSN